MKITNQSLPCAQIRHGAAWRKRRIDEHTRTIFIRSNERKPLFGRLIIAAALCAPLLLTSPAARADGWVPCNSSGTPLASNDPGYDSRTGGAILLGSGAEPTVTTTGTYSLLKSWWLAAFSPNLPSSVPPDFYGLGLSTSAANFAIDPTYGWHAGYYAPNGYSDDPDGPMPNCPDIGGTATASLSDNLTAHFVWTGPGSPPNPANFLVSYTTQATASVSEKSGLTSGLSSNADASLGSISVSAAASAPGSDFHPQSAKELKQFTPDSSGMVTISLPATVDSFSSDGINNGFWTVDPTLGPWRLYEESNGDTVASSAASANGAAAPDNRNVYISSSIETSYYKGTNPQGAVVPVPHVRYTDGGMAGDSVVFWNSVLGAYEGDGGYTAHTPSFISPAYSWTPGGGLLAAALLDQSTAVFRFGFGSTDVGPALNQTTTTSVQVTDSDGAVASNNYTINCHYPVENWAPIGARYEIAPVFIAASSVNQPTNGQVNFDVPSGEVDCSTGAKTVGGILTTVSATLAIAVPETDPIIIGLMAAGGYTLSMVEPPPPTQYTEYGTEAHFDQDVATQVALNNDEISGVFEPSVNRFNQPTRADMIEESGDEHGWFSGQEGYAFMFGVQCYRRQFYQPYIGDAYGANGYTGPQDGEITNPGSLEYVYTWY